MSDAMSAASLICDVMQMHRMSDEMDRRRQRDAVIDDLINRHNSLAFTKAALQADYNALLDKFQHLARDLEHQRRRIAELEREREEMRITIRSLTCDVRIMRPVFDKYNMHYRLGLE